MEEMMFTIDQDGEYVLSASTDDLASVVFRAPISDRRELLSLLRARICLSCAEPRTGTFTSCPVCTREYPKDP